MVIVNVRVPTLEKVYNFSLEEKAAVEDLIVETAMLILQKEGIPFNGEPHEAFRSLALCSVDGGFQLDRRSCLSDYGICGGEELMLV